MEALEKADVAGDKASTHIVHGSRESNVSYVDLQQQLIFHQVATRPGGGSPTI
jgi:hypothetical protein